MTAEPSSDQPPIDPDPSDVAFWTAWLTVCLTRPLCLKEVAAAFGVDRSRAADLVASVDGVKVMNVGSQTRYRFPVSAMPAEYLAQELRAAGVQIA